jgi:hypothetical protein
MAGDIVGYSRHVGQAADSTAHCCAYSTNSMALVLRLSPMLTAFSNLSCARAAPHLPPHPSFPTGMEGCHAPCCALLCHQVQP